MSWPSQAVGIGLTLALAALPGCARRSTQAWRPAGGAPSALNRQVRNAVDAGDGDLQVREWQRRMATQPENLDARLQLARHFESRQMPDLALEHYRLALSRFPDDVAARLGAARSLRQMSLAVEAAELLAAAPAKKSPILSTLGIVQDELGRLSDGEQSHRAALALEPENDSFHNNLGYNLMLQGRTTDAASEFRRALALQPKSEVARGNLAHALAGENPKEALLHWESLGGPATAHNNLAAALIELGKYAEARQELKAAFATGAPLPEAMHNLKLVSELDGGPASFELSSKPHALKRWGRAFRHWWVRHEDETGAAAASGRRSSTRTVAVRRADR